MKDDGMDEFLVKVLEARRRIVDHAAGSTGRQGQVDCPGCGTAGALAYSIASNGHVWARCSCGLEWME
jgi:hypothetical protein